MKIFLGSTALLSCEQMLRARRRKQHKNAEKNNYLFKNGQKNEYRYCFSMNDKESPARASFIIHRRKNYAKKDHTINNLLTLSVWSLQGKLRPRPWTGLGLRFPCNDLTLSRLISGRLSSFHAFMVTWRAHFSPIYCRSCLMNFTLVSLVFPSPQKPIFPNSSSQSGLVM